MLSFIEINKNNLIDNFNQFRRLVPMTTKILSVVKGNAYGHGLCEVVSLLDSHTDWFGVDDIDELRLLRKHSNRPTLVLGYVSKDDLRELIELGASVVVYDIDRILLLDNLGKEYNIRIPVHIKIDTELGRQGILPNEVESLIAELSCLQNVYVEGVYSHFANIEDTTDFSHAQKQIAQYKDALNLFTQAGYTNLMTHISSTAGTMVYDALYGHNSMVRIGIGLYGMWPSANLQASIHNVQLKPVLRWVTHVAQVKLLPAGFPIGYGLTYITQKPTKIAVIPQGYSDGYDRGLSSVGEVLIHGVRCKVIGRIAMNMFVVDVTHIDVCAEDEVVLLGSQGNECITAEEIASRIDTINYEVTTRISPLVPRLMK